MRHVRAMLRLALVASITLAVMFLWILAKPFLRVGSPKRIALRGLIFRTWARSLCKIMGVRVRVDGSPPKAPFLLVSNHLSYLDIPVLATAVDAVFISKAEVADWAVIGAICRSIGTIFVDRTSHRDLPRATREISEVLSGGEGVVLFPEGTSSQGAEVMPFRPSLLETAVRSGVGVSWATLHYSTPDEEPPAHLAVCWWGRMPFAAHVYSLLAISRIHAKIVFGNERILARERKALADRLHRAVIQDFTPVIVAEE
jgi:1-acyl-sn-glycerol-3-phosphate acyltransferase